MWSVSYHSLPVPCYLVKPALDERTMRVRTPGQRTNTKRHIEHLAYCPHKYKLDAGLHLLRHLGCAPSTFSLVPPTDETRLDMPEDIH